MPALREMLGRETSAHFVVDAHAVNGPRAAMIADDDERDLVRAAAAEPPLDDRVVESADLVDAGVIFGTGFAPFRGGPLHFKAAEQKSGINLTAAE